MCGIAGIVCKNQKIITRDIIKNMIDPINHRGPDDEGIIIEKNIGLGFKRLSIIDLSKLGHQPMSNKAGTIFIVFNGEIYNFLELRKICEDKGIIFSSRTDTEVIIALYEIYGEDFVKYLRGMFSIALWDKNSQKLILVRDRIGKKPLHYYNDSEFLAFGSEIKSFLKLPWFTKQINWDSFNEYFTYGFISSPKTIYQNIHKVKPGYIMIYKNGFLTEKPYWELSPSIKNIYDENEILELLRSKISESVKIRMNSDVPLGAFLSGGIDSSIIVAFMAQHSAEPIKTFSIGFGEKDFDETKYAREVSDIFSTDHTEHIVFPDYAEIIESVIADFDEPFGDSSALPTFIVSKITKEYVTVALSGDGGDELFGGYNLYSIAQKEKMFDIIPSNLKPIFKHISRIYPKCLKGKDIIYRMSVKNPQLRFIERRKLFYDYERHSLYSDKLLMNAGSYSVNELQQENFNNVHDIDFLNQCMFNDLKYYMVEDILVKVDRMTMLNSLETRCPLLDHELVELAFQLPADLKMKNGINKYLLKKLLDGYVPSNIINRRKQGFALPLTHWFNNELYEFANDLIFSDVMKESGFFNMKEVRKIYSIHKSGRRNMSYKLWLLLAFSIWLKKN